MATHANRQYWILKTEPSTFSIDDLERKKRERWDGVRNYQARNNLRSMARGDVVFIHHSSVDVPAIVGEGIVTETAYPDPLQFDLTSKYYDKSSVQDDPRWSAVTISFAHKYSSPIALATIKRHPVLKHMLLAKKGVRLSVLPVDPKHATLLSRLALGTKED